MDNLMFEEVGRTWSASNLPGDIIESDSQKTVVAQAIQYLSGSPARSVLITGDRGIGKSTIVNLIANELSQKRWKIIVAGAIDIIAGQMYIGMLDGRIKHFLSTLEKKHKVLWIVPGFHELFFAGKTVQDPSGILDRFLPYIEKGQIKVLGETYNNDLEKIIRVEPTGTEETLKLAKKWCDLSRNANSWRKISKDDLNEALKYSRQFLGHIKEPGNLFSFLKMTRGVVDAGTKSSGIKQISTDDFMFALSSVTGLPLTILDDKKKLDIENLKKKFYDRVIGQDEAVNTLIERIAMIKAGFTDPSRPLGVFLFVGPTGTGKTEIAKTLAEYLFGSEEKMIRMDMSEFKGLDSMDRLTGAGIEDTSSLVSEIRKNPFSVVLLDEFEKAHPNIWDLFLQLFDDARLTDSNGNTADFKHAIIIMTSNIGSSIPTGNSLGFGGVTKEFNADNIYKTLNNTFKPEFVNRIDRIVTFNPLSRTTMKKILKNELKKIMDRRGFRNKQWAIEWDESAIEFLLEKGFTAHLGARPMKRAIEQYLLSPLAMTIVTHQFPEGDQFVFIRKNGDRLQADFIDPDEPDTDWKERQKQESITVEKAKKLTLKKIALEAQGHISEWEVLNKKCILFKQLVDAGEWQNKKAGLLKKMSDPAFWNSENKKNVFSEIEYRDRFEESLRTVASILNRLADLKKSHTGLPSELIKQVAERLMIMQISLDAFDKGVSQDAIIKVHYETGHSSNDEMNAINFWDKICNMYLQWSGTRKMKRRILFNQKKPDAYDFVLAVEGFAAFQILNNEKGIHVWEEPKSENKYDRIRIKVDVIPFPEDVINIDSFKGSDINFFEAGNSNLKITRRYREKPSPLVRDETLEWRTGRLDKVFSGDFDLFE